MTTEETPESVSTPAPTYTESLLHKLEGKKLAVELSEQEIAEVESRLEREKARLMREVLVKKSQPATLPENADPANEPPTMKEFETALDRPGHQTLEGRIMLWLTVFQALLSTAGVVIASLGASKNNVDMIAWGGALTLGAGFFANQIAKAFSKDRSEVKKTIAQNQ